MTPVEKGPSARGEKRKEAELREAVEIAEEPLKRKKRPTPSEVWNPNWSVPKTASAFERKFYPQSFKTFVLPANEGRFEASRVSDLFWKESMALAQVNTSFCSS